MAVENSLNKEQKLAVETVNGPVLVIAGAGAGKTKVITERIKHLMQNGTDSEKILAVTFTNKAAGEMKERVGMAGPFIGTFHALGLRIIKENIKKMNLSAKPTIIDSDDSLKLIKESVIEAGKDPKQFDPSRIKNQISGFKNRLITMEKFFDEVFEEEPDGFGKILAQVWQIYENKLVRQNFLDFDDLLLKPVLLLQNDMSAKQEYQKRWEYVHIDEYQDTNEAQYELSKILAGVHRNILVVGDVDQAIYSWRGADFRNILNFQKDYPETKIITLEENYRSTDIILEAANAVIVRNKMRLPKNLWTKRQGSRQIRVIFAENGKREAELVASEISSMQKDKIPSGEIAILYRTNAQSRALEEVFLASNIPYKIIGGVRFYERQEIKDLVAYLRLIQNPADEIRYKRIANVPPRKKKKINFDELIESLRAESAGTKPHEFLKKIIHKIGYREYVNDGTEKGVERWQNIEELLGLAQQMEDVDKFLEHVSLFAIDDRYDSQTGRVNLMTMHAAKGLEFEAVFVVGLEEGLFPHILSFEPANIEEERRLCYVAMTRAKKRLYLTCASQRIIFGERASNKPSRFLAEIPEHLLVYINKPEEIEEDIYVE